MEHQKISKIFEKAQESDLLSEGGQSLAPREGEKGRKGWKKERREGSKGARTTCIPHNLDPGGTSEVWFSTVKNDYSEL